MRPILRLPSAAPIAAILLLAGILAPAPSFSKDADSTIIDGRTWVDHDGLPIPKPAEYEKDLWEHQFREAIVEPLSHGFDIPDKILALGRALGGGTKPQSENVNDFDEVANSTWFTNRNHVKALTTAEVRNGPGGSDVFPKPPYEVKSVKRQGVNPGFNIKDANDRRWVVKLDPPDHPQLGSGADAVVSRLVWAAGYNVPHDVSFTFRRDELTIDEDLKKGEDGDPPFVEEQLDRLLTFGARGADGRQYAQASLFLEGTPVGHIDMSGQRPDDPNDLYTHPDRRELRGLYVLMSWLGSWDTKDHQSLDTFVETRDSLGHVRHHLLDLGASLGAAAEGPKKPRAGFENRVDWGWMGKRFVTFGLLESPGEDARQETGIPSVGNFEAAAYDPDRFKPLQPHPAFGKRTDRDGYWGAKLVASFSDAQIAAAIDAAGYEDPRARPVLLDLLKQRRDKVLRFWFGRVAPVDFFHVDGNVLRFHDLALARGLVPARRYTARLVQAEGDRRGDAPRKGVLAEPAITLETIAGGAETIELEVGIDGDGATPAKVELEKTAGGWVVRRVVHG
jgi:hypothetical protein